MKVSVQSIGLLAPGLSSWQQARAVFRGQHVFQAAELKLPAPQGLASAERRRVGQSVKLAIACADQAFEQCEQSRANTVTVFASSAGDGQNCHLLCEALAEPKPSLSPTRFTNSVHNAAAGYWSIAAKSTKSSTSISAYDASFGAGLLEAMLYACSEQETVALIAYDGAYPFPLSEKRAIRQLFGVALILQPGETSGLARLELLSMSSSEPADATQAQPESTLDDPALEAIRQNVPAARSLPLLHAIANNQRAELTLPSASHRVIRLSTTPCP